MKNSAKQKAIDYIVEVDRKDESAAKILVQVLLNTVIKVKVMNYKINAFILFRRTIKENIETGFYTNFKGKSKIIPTKILNTLKRYWVK